MRKFRIDDLPEKYRRQVRDQIAVSAADHKPRARHAFPGKVPAEKADPPAYIQGFARIRIHHKRKSHVDPGQLWNKWVIDALVVAGILHDDSEKYVEEPRNTVEYSKAEETVIAIEVVDKEAGF